VNLGLIPWVEAESLQRRVVAARKAQALPDVLLFCEHPHTITLGRNAKLQHLLASETVLRQKSVALYHTTRGGDITYHGPGQLVGYPILNLAAIQRDVGWYMRTLEEAMIRASAEFGVSAVREAGKTGIWVSVATNAPPEKLAAIGVHLSRWVTSHGFAYNVTTDLRYFGLIVPCGIAERNATSLEKLLGKSIAVTEIARRVARHLGALLNLEMQVLPRVHFMSALERAERAAHLATAMQESLPSAPDAASLAASTEAARSNA
jgi:lipoyl(octanoyl) transferase